MELERLTRQITDWCLPRWLWSLGDYDLTQFPFWKKVEVESCRLCGSTEKNMRKKYVTKYILIKCSWIICIAWIWHICKTAVSESEKHLIFSSSCSTYILPHPKELLFHHKKVTHKLCGLTCKCSQCWFITGQTLSSQPVSPEISIKLSLLEDFNVYIVTSSYSE